MASANLEGLRTVSVKEVCFHPPGGATSSPSHFFAWFRGPMLGLVAPMALASAESAADSLRRLWQSSRASPPLTTPLLPHSRR
jgi:hypothetical protein